MLLDAELRQAPREVPTVEAARAWFREAHRTLEDGTDDERREFISHIVKRVEMTAKSEVQVEYYIPPALTADEAHGLKLYQAWLPECNPLHNGSPSPAVNQKPL